MFRSGVRSPTLVREDARGVGAGSGCTTEVLLTLVPQITKNCGEDMNPLHASPAEGIQIHFGDIQCEVIPISPLVG